MKKFMSVFLVAMMVSTLSFADADKTQLKVGVLDLPTLFQHSSHVAAMTEKAQQKFKPREDEIIALQKSLNDAQARMKRDASIASKSDLAKLQDDIQAKQRDLRRKQEDYLQDKRAAEESIFKGMVAKVNAIVQKIAEKEHYDLILQRNNVAFASTRVDITQQVLEAIEKQK